MSCYHDDPVVSAKLVKHQHAAVAHLVTGDLSKLDPTTGDASCQVRAVTTLTFYYDLRGAFDDSQWVDVVALSKKYLHAHATDKPDTKVKTVSDAKGASHSTEFDALVALVRKHFGEEKFELLGLKHSLWAAGIVSTDEFWIDFKYRNNNQWGTHDKALKARLANLSCDAFMELARQLSSDGKWVEVLERTRSVIKNEAADDIPVLSIQATFGVAMAVLYERGIPIIDGNLRIQLNVNAALASSSDASDPTPNVTYSFGTSRYLLFVPNRTTGKFELVKNPSPEQMRSPAFFLKSWSTYFEGATTDGLYSSTHEEYYAAREGMDIQWAIDVYASLHPPFTGCAEDADIDIGAAYANIFPPRAQVFACNRFALQGHTYAASPHERPNLAERYNHALRVADQGGLDGDRQFVRVWPPFRECAQRLAKPVDWQVVHALAATPQWAEEQLRACADRHEAAKGAVIGRYVFALGAVGASHEVQDEATALHNTKKEVLRRQKYLKMYPQNEPLLRR
ncbi:hypothetical protein DFH06DRAFT_1344954 [Mycena polygramma]|nr:hypothetical protein DFH06DRAFT_1344954 [Mycena polygramma]